METRIGEAAGKIWQALHAKGPMRTSGIAKATGLPGGLLNQGIGWLAREGKIAFEMRKGRKEVYRLQ